MVLIVSQTLVHLQDDGQNLGNRREELWRNRNSRIELDKPLCQLRRTRNGNTATPRDVQKPPRHFPSSGSNDKRCRKGLVVADSCGSRVIHARILPNRERLSPPP
jgi:hypothetical protein